MVTITGYALQESKEKKSFVTLNLQGDVVLVQSARSGRFYATAKSCTITSTFDEAMAQSLIGKTLPGKIDKVATDPYEYVIAETGEVITLTHRWQYVPEEVAAPYTMRVVHKELVA